MTQQIRLDITPFFQPLAALRNEPLRSIDGLAHLRDGGVEPSEQLLYWLGPVWVRDDGEGLTAISPDQQLAVVWASPCYPDAQIPVAILARADAEKAELFLSHVMEARLGTSPTALDLLVRALYSNDAQGRTLRTLLFGTAAKALGVEEICRRVLFNPQKVSLFNQRKKALGLTRKRREPEHEKIQQTSESKLTQEDCPAEEPSVANEAESEPSLGVGSDELADCWLGRHISLGDIPAPELDIVELRSLLEKTDVSEDKLLEGLKDTWQARYDASDKTNPGQLFAELRAVIVSRLRKHAGAKQNDPHPN